MGKKVRAKSAADESSESPAVSRRPRASKRPGGVKKPSRLRHLSRLSYLLVPAGLVLGLVLYVYYQRYSAIIDSGLQGKIFERSSGIYAAPLALHAGAPMRLNDLIQHLQRVGYVQRGAAETATRGRYTLAGNSLEIIPSADATIDGAKLFHPLRVSFGLGGAGIQSITATDTSQNLTDAQIEPEQITAAINEQREKRKIIEYKDLPPVLVNSIVVIEDRTFFEHSGVSIRGILRAFFRNYEAGEVREGGSTITQQLVKGFFLTPERRLKRKLAEAYMAIILEQKLTKEQIMGMYCNQIYLGQRGGFSINGFGEAARAYFGKDVSYLQPHEAALLAGIIRSPNYYSPYSHEQRAIDRRNFVLDQLAQAGKLTPAEAEQAKRQPLGVIGRGGTDAADAPYFVDFVTRQLERQYGEDTQSMRSMRVYTTVDLDLQHAAYAAVAKNMPEIDRLVGQRRGGRTTGLQVAVVAMNAHTGDILAMIGGRDYAMSQLNRATDAKRQPGSVFKPFVYAAGLSDANPERRITAAMVFNDEPRSFEFGGKFYSPGNFGDTYENRAMTAREALYKSKNVIAVSVAERIGFPQVAAFAEKAGLANVPAFPSVALGVAEATPLQIASAYTSFANQGRRAAPVAIRRITTKEGSTLYDAQTQTNEVMSPQVAYLMTTILQDVLDHGTGTRVRQMGFREIAAGKTGSSRDGWFAGYTKDLVCAVWIGFDDNTDIGVTGGSTAALIWADFMIRAMQLRPDLGGPFEPPTEGLVTLYIDPATGSPAQTDTPGARAELFLSGTESGAGQPYSPPPVPEGGPIKVTPEGVPPITTEPASTSPAEPAARPDNRGVPSAGDSMIPLPPEARGKVTLSGAAPVEPSVPFSPIPRPTADRPPIRVADARPRPVATPIPARPVSVARPAQGNTTRPAQSNTAKSTQAIPARRGAIPGPTPWPTPRMAPVSSSSNSRTNVIVIPTPTPDTRAIRPRIVPTPAPKSKPPERAAKTVAASKNAPPKTVPPKTAAKPSPVKPGSNQLAKATKPAPKPTIKPTPQSRPTPIPPTPTPALAKATTSSGKMFFLDVCAVSGLIPVKGVCKTTVRRAFRVGEEPTRQCSPDRHGGN